MVIVFGALVLAWALCAPVALAARDASDFERQVFAAVLSADGRTTCEGGRPVSPADIYGRISTRDSGWATAGVYEMTPCTLGDFVLQFNQGAWRVVTRWDFTLSTYCNAHSPRPPVSVATDLDLCQRTPPGPVLGVTGLFGAYGKGWGSRKPRRIYNGGVPSGLVTGIRWRRWGKGTARGYGKTSIYKPSGGYYSSRGRIQLKAYRLGRCETGGPKTYRRLKVREQVKPGGRYGKWFIWSGINNLCNPVG